MITVKLEKKVECAGYLPGGAKCKHVLRKGQYARKDEATGLVYRPGWCENREVALQKAEGHC